MQLCILFSCIFGIGPASLFARADWVDQIKLHEATNFDAHNKPHGSHDAGEIDAPNDLVPSSSEFSEIRNSRAFIDKTFFLHEWLTHRPNHWYVTAPSGFGKTALAKMAVQFLNASAEIVDGVEKFHDKRKTAAYELFQGTNIFEMKEFFDQHFQNYAVIYVDLSPLSNTTQAVFNREDDFNTQDFHKYFKLVIKTMMNHYPSLLSHQNLTERERRSFKEYLESGMETAVRPTLFWNSILFLRKLLEKTLKLNVVIIIDSYDAVCKPCIIGELLKVQRPYLSSYMINLSKIIMQDRLSIILYLGTINARELMLKKPSKSGEQKGAGTLTHTAFSSEERLAKHFGLSKEEVASILSKYSMENHLNIVNDLFNGHAVMKSSLTLFNTKYVLTYIKNQNASPTAFTTPLTSNILQYCSDSKMFTSEWVSDVVTQCIYKDKAVVRLSPSLDVSFASFTRLRILMGNVSGVIEEESLSPGNTQVSIRLLQFLGLISAMDENANSYDLRASSRNDAELMNNYVYSSNSVQRLFKIMAEDELMMIRAVKGLAPNNESMQSLGEAIHKIFRVKFPEAEYQLKSLVYVYARKVAVQNSEDYTMDGGIAAPTMEHSKLQGEGRPSVGERLDVILLQKHKSLGIMISSKFNRNATSVLKEMTDRGYTDILDADSRFANLKIKNKILIGISASRNNQSVEIAAEVWHQNGRTSLKHVMLNDVSHA